MPKRMTSNKHVLATRTRRLESPPARRFTSPPASALLGAFKNSRERRHHTYGWTVWTQYVANTNAVTTRCSVRKPSSMLRVLGPPQRVAVPVCHTGPIDTPQRLQSDAIVCSENRLRGRQTTASRENPTTGAVRPRGKPFAVGKSPRGKPLDARKPRETKLSAGGFPSVGATTRLCAACHRDVKRRHAPCASRARAYVYLCGHPVHYTAGAPNEFRLFRTRHTAS